MTKVRGFVSSRQGFVFLLAAALVAAAVCCTLNPQPIPPELAAGPLDGGGFGSGDNLSDDAASNPETPPEDAGNIRNPDAGDGGLDPNSDGGDDAGDAGDGGDDGTEPSDENED